MPAGRDDTKASDDSWVRVGDFLFNVKTGELEPVECEESARGTRLGPQPAKLLSLLLHRNGDLVAREDIRGAIWPDVSVDFDQSLHDCVRQIRVALGDSPKMPKYIETVPRRGYRLVCEVEHGAGRRAVPPSGVVAKQRQGAIVRRRRWLAGIGMTAVGLAVVAATWVLRHPSKLRLAIVPFGTASPADAPAVRLGEQVLVAMTRAVGTEVDILGPRATGPLLSRGMTLTETATALEVDYVLNARSVQHRGSSELLIELIRISDGRHVWVEYLSEGALEDDLREPVANVVAGVHGAMARAGSGMAKSGE